MAITPGLRGWATIQILVHGVIAQGGHIYVEVVTRLSLGFGTVFVIHKHIREFVRQWF